MRLTTKSEKQRVLWLLLNKAFSTFSTKWQGGHVNWKNITFFVEFFVESSWRKDLFSARGSAFLLVHQRGRSEVSCKPVICQLGSLFLFMFWNLWTVIRIQFCFFRTISPNIKKKPAYLVAIVGYFLSLQCSISNMVRKCHRINNQNWWKLLSSKYFSLKLHPRPHLPQLKCWRNLPKRPLIYIHFTYFYVILFFVRLL